MQISEIEAWVHELIRTVGDQQNVEDGRVELKSEWPEPQKAARRLGGHLNASRGEPILWVIGLDEKRGVVEFDAVDTAEWVAKVRSEFEGAVPGMQDVRVPSSQGPVVALLFHPERAPFVVKNPAHGQPKGGPVALEVPWREGTSVRSARREDLLQLLVPLQRVPHLECLTATLTAELSEGIDRGYGGPLEDERAGPHCWWQLDVNLYVTPRSENRVVLPVHKAGIDISADETVISGHDLNFHTPSIHTGSSFRSDSHTIATTQGEALIDGPGRLNVRASAVIPYGAILEDDVVFLDIWFGLAGEDGAMGELNVKLGRVEGKKGGKWEYKRE